MNKISNSPNLFASTIMASFILVSSASLAVAETVESQKPTPKNPSYWSRFVHQSYPPAAVTAGVEGTVGVQVVVGTNGRVTNCSVRITSGHKLLDEAACDSMLQYAEFYPAKDRSGRSVVGSYSTVITYKLPIKRTPMVQDPDMT